MIVESEEPIFKRHPFVWLVEAADDICYNIIDMEDAHRLGIISTADCEKSFHGFDKICQRKRRQKEVQRNCFYFRIKMREFLI